MKKVPSEGPRDAKIVFVGEAPGKDEERKGRPFIGYSGMVARNELRNVGIDPDAVFITNVCKYRPKYNKIQNFFDSYRSRKPGRRIKEGMAELYADLAEIRPDIIVPVGNTALWALTGNWGVSKYRGSLLEAKISDKRALCAAEFCPDLDQLAEQILAINGTKVIPTLHPAYIVRQWLMKPIFNMDLKLVVKVLRDPSFELIQREYIIDPPRDQALEIAEKLINAEQIAVDIETPGSKLYCVGFAIDPTWGVVFRTDEHWKLDLIRAVCESDVPKVFQNGVFDVSYMKKFTNIDINNYAYDTMFAHHAAYPEYKKGLDFQLSFYLDGEPYYKDEGKDQDLTIAKDVQEYLEYNAKDNVYTLDIAQRQQTVELKDPAYRGQLDRVMSITPIVVDMMVNGIRIDKKKFDEHKKEYTQNFYQAQKELDFHVLDLLHEKVDKVKTTKQEQKIVKFAEKVVAGMGTKKGGLNVESSKDLKLFIYDIMGFKVKKYKKKPSVKEELLKELFGETGSQVLLEIVVVKKLRTMLSRYLNPNNITKEPNGEHRVYYSVNPVGTKTGRWSMSKTIRGEGWNGQTTPSPIRDIMIPEDGYVMAYYDLSQVEDRVVAYLGEIEAKKHAYENNIDAHCLTAKYLFDLDSWEEVEKGSPQRYLGKQCNHAFNYEEGPMTFYRNVNKKADETGVRITYAEAKKLRSRHMNIAYPGLKEYWSDIRARVKRDRHLINPFGWKRKFHGRLDDATFRDAYSWIPQSTAPAIIDRGAVGIHKELPMVKISLQVHDALLLQIPISEFWDIHGEILRLMTFPIEVGGHEIVVPVDCEGIGYNWKDLADPKEFFAAVEA